VGLVPSTDARVSLVASLRKAGHVFFSLPLLTDSGSGCASVVGEQGLKVNSVTVTRPTKRNGQVTVKLRRSQGETIQDHRARVCEAHRAE
jgi:predicted ATPase